MTRTVYNFSGGANAGAVSVPGVRAGDRVLAVFKTSSLPYEFPDNASFFLAYALADSQLHQLNNDDLSSATYAAVVER